MNGTLIIDSFDPLLKFLEFLVVPTLWLQFLRNCHRGDLDKIIGMRVTNSSRVSDLLSGVITQEHVCASQSTDQPAVGLGEVLNNAF